MACSIDLAGPGRSSKFKPQNSRETPSPSSQSTRTGAVIGSLSLSLPLNFELWRLPIAHPDTTEYVEAPHFASRSSSMLLHGLPRAINRRSRTSRKPAEPDGMPAEGKGLPVGYKGRPPAPARPHPEATPPREAHQTNCVLAWGARLFIVAGSGAGRAGPERVFVIRSQPASPNAPEQPDAPDQATPLRTASPRSPTTMKRCALAWATPENILDKNFWQAQRGRTMKVDRRQRRWTKCFMRHSRRPKTTPTRRRLRGWAASLFPLPTASLAVALAHQHRTSHAEIRPLTFRSYDRCSHPPNRRRRCSGCGVLPMGGASRRFGSSPTLRCSAYEGCQVREGRLRPVFCSSVWAGGPA